MTWVRFEDQLLKDYKWIFIYIFTWTSHTYYTWKTHYSIPLFIAPFIMDFNFLFWTCSIYILLSYLIFHSFCIPCFELAPFILNFFASFILNFFASFIPNFFASFILNFFASFILNFFASFILNFFASFILNFLASFILNFFASFMLHFPILFYKASVYDDVNTECSWYRNKGKRLSNWSI